jgi:hypothetical protein
MRKQTAVYWPPGSTETGGQDYDEYAKPLYGQMVQIACRWEDVNEEFVGPDGERDTTRSIVYTDRDVAVRGVLMLGVLGDVTDPDDPKSNVNAWEIRRFDKLPNLRNTEVLRKAYL